MTSKRPLAALAVITLCASGCDTGTPVAAGSGSPPVPVSSSAAGGPDSFAEGTQPSLGPLVFIRVIDWVGSEQVSHSKATFHLTDHCAYLHGPPEEPVLLVWPDGQAWVDPASPSTVQFREPASGMQRHLTDGQQVDLGGYAIGGHGYTYSPPPHGSCPSNGNDFVVHEVR